MKLQLTLAAFVMATFGISAVTALPAGQDFVKRDGETEVGVKADISLTEDTQVGDDYFMSHDY